MRVLLIALLAAISYAQTDVDNFFDLEAGEEDLLEIFEEARNILDSLSEVDQEQILGAEDLELFTQEKAQRWATPLEEDQKHVDDCPAFDADLKVEHLDPMFGLNTNEFDQNQSWRMHCGSSPEELMQELLTWIRINGGTIKEMSLKMGKLPGRDIYSLESRSFDARGVFMKESVQKDDTLFWIPFYLTLYPEVALKDAEIGSILENSDLSQNASLLVWVLYQLYNIKTSPYRPYLCTLPLTTPSQGLEDKADGLHPSLTENVYDAILPYMLKTSNSYMKFHSIKDLHPNLFPSKHFNLENWEWIYGIVNGRSWSRISERDPVAVFELIPLASLFNHDDNGRKVGIRDNGRILVASKDMKIGDQVYINYGKHSIIDYLTVYGFLPP